MLTEEEAKGLFECVMKTRGPGGIDPFGDALISAIIRCQKSPERVEAFRDTAAYLLDRADQHSTDSPCWIALADAARNVVRGEVDAALNNGDLTDDLYTRLDR